MAKLISGVQIAKDIRAELHEDIEKWVGKGRRAPHLTAILIGDDPASHTYVNNKIKVSAKTPSGESIIREVTTIDDGEQQ